MIRTLPLTEKERTKILRLKEFVSVGLPLTQYIAAMGTIIFFLLYLNQYIGSGFIEKLPISMYGMFCVITLSFLMYIGIFCTMHLTIGGDYYHKYNFTPLKAKELEELVLLRNKYSSIDRYVFELTQQNHSPTVHDYKVIKGLEEAEIQKRKLSELNEGRAEKAV